MTPPWNKLDFPVGLVLDVIRVGNPRDDLDLCFFCAICWMRFVSVNNHLSLLQVEHPQESQLLVKNPWLLDMLWHLPQGSVSLPCPLWASVGIIVILFFLSVFLTFFLIFDIIIIIIEVTCKEIRTSLVSADVEVRSSLGVVASDDGDDLPHWPLIKI